MQLKAHIDRFHTRISSHDDDLSLNLIPIYFFQNIQSTPVTENNVGYYYIVYIFFNF